jgi:hypothetical protein
VSETKELKERCRGNLPAVATVEKAAGKATEEEST